MIDLDEILNDPMLEIDEKQMELFDMPEDMRNIMAERKQPEHYAERKPCENFEDYRPLFAKVKAELMEGKRSLIRTGKSSNFDAGNFYYIDGIMVYLESVGKATKASNGMKYARTRCIYENGVEQDLLLETLRKNVTTSGYAITQTEEQLNSAFFDNADITEDDKVTGYIYVLRSLSDVPEIAEVKNLYKIGFTTTTVEERIANAEHEPTYMMAPVEIVASYKVVNMNSHMFESLVHQVLKAVNFRVEVKDEAGNVHAPKEWYVAPLTVIDIIAQRIMDGSIVNYVYNAQLQCLECNNTAKTSPSFDNNGPISFCMPEEEKSKLKILTLIIKQCYFDEIIAGRKKQEFREVKPTTIKKLLQLDDEGYEIEDEQRNAIPIEYDAIQFYVGYNSDRDYALVEVKGTRFEMLRRKIRHGDGTVSEEYIEVDWGDKKLWYAEQVVYDLGKVLECKKK